jgi:hypothetical protein
MSGNSGSLDDSVESWFGAPVYGCQAVLAIQWLWSFSKCGSLSPIATLSGRQLCLFA